MFGGGGYEVSYSDQGLVSSSDDNDQLNGGGGGSAYQTRMALKSRFVEFIRNFRQENSFPYRDQLRKHTNLNLHYLEVDMNHLLAFDEHLANYVTNSPFEALPLFEIAATEALRVMQVSEMNE